MKILFDLKALCLALLTISGVKCDKQPNIVFVLFDDLGWADVG
jgi:hypothetical protein